MALGYTDGGMYYAPKRPPRADLEILTMDRKIVLFDLDTSDVNSGYDFEINYDNEGNIKKVTILADVNEEVYGLYEDFDDDMNALDALVDDITMGYHDYDDGDDLYGDGRGYRG